MKKTNILTFILSVFQINAFADNPTEKSLESFITSTLSQHKTTYFETQNTKANYTLDGQKKFNHLHFYNIKLHEELDFNLEHYYVQQQKIKKMQKIASHISDEYNIPLSNSEEIVINSFVEAKKKKLDPILVLSLINVESTFNQYAKSTSGAIGLTQVIPSYHREKIATLTNKRFDIWSISGNIKIGTEVLREYLKLSNGNIINALQRYNGTLNDESREYSKKVLAKAKTLSAIANS